MIIFVLSFHLGQIYLRKALDYETTKSLRFDVTATASGSKSQVFVTSTSVEITVIDVDDNCPVFTTPSYFEVSVSSPLVSGRIISHMKFGDEDSFTNHVFSVTSGLFEIDSFGMLRSKTMLTSLSDQFYNVSVQVRDTRCSATSYVGVHLKSCDNPSTHMFASNGMYEVTVSEDRPIGTSVVKVAINGNQSHSFSILGSAANQQFAISPSTGRFLNLDL